jgi:hypothetical protein
MANTLVLFCRSAMVLRSKRVVYWRMCFWRKSARLKAYTPPPSTSI